MDLKEYKFSKILQIDKRWGYHLVITSFKNADGREALVYVNSSALDLMLREIEAINECVGMDMLEFIRKYDISKIRFASDLI